MSANLERLRAEVGDVIAKHDRVRNAADFVKYADDPAGFMRDVLHCEPWARQIEMAESARDHPRTVVVTANGLGKDWATARIALWWIYARRGFVILTGPTERQVKQILMREVRKAFALAPELPGELFALELRVDEKGECGLLAFTSDNSDKLTGFHHPRLLIAMTEGQGCEDACYEAARACCTGSDNRLFVYGNPTRIVGEFARIAESDAWHTISVAATEHPNVVHGREEIPGAVSQAWIDAIADEYGAASSVYKSRVLAQFPTESVEGLVQRAWLRAAFDRHESGELAASVPFSRPVVAVDVARFGPDASVAALVRGPVVESLTIWRGASITESADKVDQMLKGLVTHHYKLGTTVPLCVVDEPGLGGGLIDVLRRKGNDVEGFNGGSAKLMGADAQRFLNQRALTHWQFREMLENNRIALPRDKMLEEEALAVEWTFAQHESKVQMLSKDTMRGTLGRSPDRLDAVIIGLAYSIGGAREGLKK